MQALIHPSLFRFVQLCQWYLLLLINTLSLWLAHCRSVFCSVVILKKSDETFNSVWQKTVEVASLNGEYHRVLIPSSHFVQRLTSLAVAIMTGYKFYSSLPSVIWWSWLIEKKKVIKMILQTPVFIPCGCVSHNSQLYTGWRFLSPTISRGLSSQWHCTLWRSTIYSWRGLQCGTNIFCWGPWWRLS